jgi:N-acylglucosamine-6-phosphate 2-epimerase
VSATLDRLRGRLLVSVQASAGSALDDPRVIAAMARAAQDAGAAAVRIQGIANLEAVMRAVDVPVIGLLKREYPGFEPYITPAFEDVRAVLAAGAPIVAFDATARARPDGATPEQIALSIHDAGALAMADCADADDGVCAQAFGADIVASTLCGYTKETAGVELPALDLVRALAELDTFVVCEGGIASPESGRAALDAGADAICVGSAITGIGWLVGEFTKALSNYGPRDRE